MTGPISAYVLMISHDGQIVVMPLETEPIPLAYLGHDKFNHRTAWTGEGIDPTTGRVIE